MYLHEGTLGIATVTVHTNAGNLALVDILM